jgi:hypothetical protein
MSVVESHKHALYSVPGERCTFCGERAFPPYLEWCADTVVIVCAECARRIQHGFGRDLRELAALRQFQLFCSRPVQPEDVRQ